MLPASLAGSSLFLRGTSPSTLFMPVLAWTPHAPLLQDLSEWGYSWRMSCCCVSCMHQVRVRLGSGSRLGDLPEDCHSVPSRLHPTAECELLPSWLRYRSLKLLITYKDRSTTLAAEWRKAVCSLRVCWGEEYMCAYCKPDSLCISYIVLLKENK